MAKKKSLGKKISEAVDHALHPVPQSEPEKVEAESVSPARAPAKSGAYEQHSKFSKFQKPGGN